MPGAADAKFSPASDWDSAARAQRIHRLLADFSIETVPLPDDKVPALAAALPPGTDVYVAAPPSRGPADIVATAAALRAAGLRPVPHIAARTIADRDRLADFLWRLRARAEVDQVLLVGGTRRLPVGAFATALDALETGLFEELGIGRVGLAAHPEGHPDVADAALADALDRKLAYGRGHGLDMYLVSQFCFDPHAIIRWTAAARARHGAVALHIGVPGPGSLTGLVKFARMCRIGNSVHLLTRGVGAALKLANWTPDGLLSALAYFAAANPESGIARIHFFSFGGAAHTAAWLAAIRAGRLRVHPDGRGFTVAG